MKKLLILLIPVLLASCATPAGSASGSKSYPLATCLVSDNELGSMGPVISRDYQGQTVKFCCKPCVRKFERDPAAYLGKIAAP